MKPNIHNSNRHSEQQIIEIANSIQEFGFTKPIVIDENDVILAGHGAREASLIIPLDTVPCVVKDRLSEEQKRAYLIADNKIARNSEWDFDVLRTELLILDEAEVNMTLLGFSDDELRELKFDGNFPPVTRNEQGRLDGARTLLVICPHCGEQLDARQAEAVD